MIVIADAIKAAVMDKDETKAMKLVKSITSKYPLYAQINCFFFGEVSISYGKLFCNQFNVFFITETDGGSQSHFHPV